MFGYIIIFIISFLIGWGVFSNSKSKKKFNSEYSDFLSANEGLEIFCYTNREKFQNIIEKEILPNLKESIKIIKLEGKEPNTSLNKKFISHALYSLKNVGFPNIMKVVNGQFIDISLHSEIYNSINNGKPNELVKIVNEKLEILRQSHKELT